MTRTEVFLINKTAILVHLFLRVLVSFTAVFLIYYISSLTFLEHCSTKFVPENAQKLLISDHPVDEALKVLYDNEISFYAASGEDTTAIAFYGEQLHPPIIEGRFFQEGDFFKSQFLAVIGQNLKSSIDTSLGYPSIQINHTAYRVIGIVGTSIDTPINNCIYYNLDSMTNKDIIYLGGLNRNKVESAVHYLQNSFDIKLIDDPISGINRLIGYSTGTIIILIAFCFILIYFLFCMQKYHFAYRKEFYQIEILFGTSRRRVALKSAVETFMIQFASFIFSIILIRLLARIPNLQDIILQEMLNCSELFFVAAILFFVFLLFPSIILSFFYCSKRLNGDLS